MPAWQAELRSGFQSVDALLGYLGLDRARCGVAPEAAAEFPLRVPRSFAALMRPGDPDDPLLRQVLPLAAELEVAPGFGPDPVGDLASVRAPGVLHKYAGRALVVTTGACAIHCRYCFRRGFPYGEHGVPAGAVAATVGALAGDPGLQEIILSGGDPLVLPDRRLGEWLDAIDAAAPVRRIRIHTRLPVVLPARVDPGLLATLGRVRKPLTIVVHCNHPRELGDDARAALLRLRPVAAALLNQAVLLRGVNASADVLVELSEALFSAGVLPYYLHQLDAVQGAAHFAVPDAEAIGIVATASARLPGYLVPRLVREIAGAPAKTPLADAALHNPTPAT